MGVLLFLVTAFIPVLFVVNLGVYWLARKMIIALERMIYPKTNRRDGVLAELSITEGESLKLRESTCRASMWYSLFVNITAVFPLLGILGTVMSLMNLSGTDDLSANFSSALLTTFLGLIAAIFFKLIDAWISSRLDRALEEADYIIHQHDKEQQEKAQREKEKREKELREEELQREQHERELHQIALQNKEPRNDELRSIECVENET
ncbi:MAG: MotA/TolQ/ExbB proton channel family protein [Oscillospiraceae bacterium]|nr:MotA/TolQ/ExbB proton channel family protein [Oscillospiraceae bacterium]